MKTRELAFARLVAICLLLRLGKKLTAPGLAKRFRMTLRTIYRDIETLQRVGIPISSTTGPQGGYTLTKLGDIDPNAFSNEKSIAEFLSSSLAIRNTSMARSELLDKILAEAHRYVSHVVPKPSLEKEKRILFDTGEWYWHNESEAFLESMKDAVFNNTRIRLLYHERHNLDTIEDLVDPYGLVWKAGAWYLVAYCHHLKLIRRIRVQRIVDAHPTEEKFDRCRSFELSEFWMNDLKTFGSGNTKVVLRIEEPALRDFERFGWKDDTQIQKKDKYWIAKLFVDRWEWLVPLVLSYAGDLIVLQPAKLRDRILRETKLLTQAHLMRKRISPDIEREPSDIRERVTRGRDYL